ncbi:MAG: type II 3-dehydroquinate dehydratase [Clostridia bacterium]|nr:type II 3-dehydroquinate dehydratase [Clostridia bacterium]
MKIMVINGPNLNMLGIREPEIYGDKTFADLENIIEEHGKEKGIEITSLQSNSEGEIIDYIHYAYGNYDGIVINPGAYTHYSYAIADAISAVSIPTVEVHISDINKREEFRKISVTKAACVKQISGHGFDGYLEAIDFLCQDK